jgi:glutaryl-CoA dehydrogenase
VSFQIVQDRLVKMLAEICSMQLYCLRLGRLIEEGKLTDTIAAIAKMNNTRKARQVIAAHRPAWKSPVPARQRRGDDRARRPLPQQ